MGYWNMKKQESSFENTYMDKYPKNAPQGIYYTMIYNLTYRHITKWAHTSKRFVEWQI